jgi:hypothetical protein
VTSAEASSRQSAFAALLDACRLWLGTSTSGALGDPQLDWERFGQLAFVHNLEPLLHFLQAEDRLQAWAPPGSLRERWEKAYFDNFVFNTRALEIIQPFCEACDRQQIRIAFFKGPVIAARVFSDSALRVMVDLDVLCREQDLEHLVQLADSAGFGGGHENAVYHLSLTHRETPLLLELHFKPYDFLPSPETVLANLLESVEPCVHGEFVFPALPPHLETAMEIAHLVNHDLRVNLKPLLDLAGGVHTLGASAPLGRTLATWDLEPEATIIADLLEKLFSIEAPFAGPLPTSGAAILETALARIEQVDLEERPALGELAVRPGLLTKLDYLRRLLGPSRRRLRAASAQSESASRGARLTHLRRTFRRGWNKLSRAGLASASDASIKRELLRRRLRH